MPSAFSTETIIGPGWRCTQSLRHFFEAHCGRDFRFNEALRDFIAAGSGRPLAEAIAVYAASRKSGPRPIAPQFEYNRHMRDYRAAHPGSTHAEAVAAWWARREKPST